jgi:hypothetical protein
MIEKVLNGFTVAGKQRLDLVELCRFDPRILIPRVRRNIVFESRHIGVGKTLPFIILSAPKRGARFLRSEKMPSNEVVPNGIFSCMKTNTLQLPITVTRELAPAIVDQLPSEEYTKFVSDIR